MCRRFDPGPHHETSTKVGVFLCSMASQYKKEIQIDRSIRCDVVLNSMVRFFDFLFLRFFKFYAGHNEKGAQSTAAGIVGGFQAVNILTVLMLLSLIYHDKVFVSNKLFILGMAIFFQVTTYIRYIVRDGKNLPIIKKQWDENSESQLIRHKLYASAYMLISLLAILFIAIYVGNQKW